MRCRRDRELFALSYRYSASSRPMNLVRMASLWAARRMAAPAVARSTPSISNKIFPGRITATHCSGAPLPLPMRVSAGFLVMGLSGNSRIHTLPPRLMERGMATRAASIFPAVTQPHSMAFRPNSPKEIDDPRHALPVMRPRCCFRYFTFFGIIMAVYPESPVGSRRGCRTARPRGRAWSRFPVPARFAVPAALPVSRTAVAAPSAAAEWASRDEWPDAADRPAAPARPGRLLPPPEPPPRGAGGAHRGGVHVPHGRRDLRHG